MAARKPAATRSSTAAPTGPIDPAVVAFLAALDHPLKQEIEAARQMLLGASPAIHEGIKWNAPSFRTTEYFATTNLRSRDVLQFVFHRGAKVRAPAAEGMDIPDPEKLLKWLAPDRCLVTLGAGAEVEGRRGAFEAIVRAWIVYV